MADLEVTEDVQSWKKCSERLFSKKINIKHVDKEFIIWIYIIISISIIFYFLSDLWYIVNQTNNLLYPKIEHIPIRTAKIERANFLCMGWQ